MKLLVVHSDDDVRKILLAQLADHGLELLAASTVAEAREAITSHTFDVAIVDLSLDNGSGSLVVEAIRVQGSTTHILVLSRSAHESDHRSALAAGADEYFVKPVIASELTARVLAIGRRFRSEADATLRVHHLEIDLTARVVTAHGKSVRLTTEEFDLLTFLATRPELIFSMDELLQAVWNTSDEGRLNLVAQTVARLRNKIELDPKHPRILHTIRGAGYCLEIPDAGAGQGRMQTAQIPGTLVEVKEVIVSADTAAVAMMGYQREEDLVGQHIFDLMAPSSRAAIRERLRVVSQGGSPRSQVFELGRSDGVELSVAMRSSACEWQGLSARTKTLTPIADPSSRLRHLVTGVFGELADAIIVTDLHFHVRSWNRAAHRLYGWSEQEAIGRHLLDVVPWANDTDRLSSTWHSLEATGRWYGVGRQMTRTGTEIAIYASTTLVRDEQGEPMGVVSVNRRAESAAGSNFSQSTTTEAEIREGIDNDEFVVHYQPVVDLEDKRIVSFEALVRWNHPRLGLLRPSAFIEVAEQSSLIVELGAKVLDQACRQTVEWQRHGADITIAVNISGRELTDPTFVARVADTLTTTGLDPRSLWLEVTETVLVEDLDQVRLRLARLAETGIGIAIDDFGTGWASLLYLRQFPVRALKIDRVFVSGVDRKANDTAIARSILSLGADLDLVVVAEGVETVAQEGRLRKLGCRFAQGYLYGRPTPATAAPMQQCRKLEASTAGVVSEDSMIDAQVPLAFATATQGVVVATGASGRRANSQAPPGDRGSGASTSTLTPIAPTASAATEDSAAVRMLRGLLRIRSAEHAARLLQDAAVALGGSLVAAAEAGTDALPLDLSLGEGAPVLVEAESMSLARLQLEQFLPRLAEDARQAVHLLRHNERLEDASTTDRLTGLPNRRVLDRVLPRATDGVVIFIDLDHFKQVNDTAGHDAGDAVLAEFGEMLNREVRASDTCCRLGGEEFVIVTAGATISDARDLTVRLRTAWLEAAPLPVTFSAGVAAIGDAGGAAALAAADRALYRAKASGRNRTEFEVASASDL